MFGCQDYPELMFKFMQISVETKLNLRKLGLLGRISMFLGERLEMT